jgi:outer membrane protein assembly factor BamB
MNRRSVLAMLGSVSLAGCSALPDQSPEPVTLSAPDDEWTQFAGSPERRQQATASSVSVPEAPTGVVDLGVQSTAAPVLDGSTALFSTEESLVGVELSDRTTDFEYDVSGLPNHPPARSGSVVAVQVGDRLDGYSLDTGERLWREQVTRGARDGTAPAAFDDHVLVHDDGDLRLLAAETGTERWRTGREGTMSGIRAFAGDTDRLVANRYGDGETSTVVGYDAATGEETWQVEIQSSPTRPLVGDAVYLVSKFGRLVAVADGTVQWQVETGGQYPADVALAEDVVVVASRTDDSVVGVSLSAETVVWETSIEFVRSVVTVGDSVFVAGGNAGIVELDVATGTERRRHADAKFPENLTPTPEGLLFTRATDGRAFLVPTA